MIIQQTKIVQWRPPASQDPLDVLKVGTEKPAASPLRARGIPGIGAWTSLGKVVSVEARHIHKDRYEIEIGFEF